MTSTLTIPALNAADLVAQASAFTGSFSSLMQLLAGVSFGAYAVSRVVSLFKH